MTYWKTRSPFVLPDMSLGEPPPRSPLTVPAIIIKYGFALTAAPCIVYSMVPKMNRCINKHIA